MDKWQKARQITGFRALYLYYCYKLGVFPKRRPQNRARLHFLLREDLIKLNNISQEVRLLARHHIDTAEQLALYKKEQEVQITTLSAQRRALQKALRTKPSGIARNRLMHTGRRSGSCLNGSKRCAGSCTCATTLQSAPA